MGKTDKELMTDIVCSYINAWGTQNNCVPVKQGDLPSLIKSVYDTIAGLEKEQ